VRAPLDLAWAHRHQGLRSVNRLNLALFIDAQNQRALGRRQVQPDDVAHLLDEQRIGEELEGFAAMGLEIERFPQPVNCSSWHLI
jgi:hypothetical protein